MKHVLNVVNQLPVVRFTWISIFSRSVEMNLDETQALELGQDYDDEEEEVERSRKLVGLLIMFLFLTWKNKLMTVCTEKVWGFGPVMDETN